MIHNYFDSFVDKIYWRLETKRGELPRDFFLHATTNHSYIIKIYDKFTERDVYHQGLERYYATTVTVCTYFTHLLPLCPSATSLSGKPCLTGRVISFTP